jgi:hypothetical protein
MEVTLVVRFIIVFTGLRAVESERSVEKARDASYRFTMPERDLGKWKKEKGKHVS